MTAWQEYRARWMDVSAPFPTPEQVAMRRLDRAIARDMGRTSTTCRDCHGIGHLTHNPTIECPRCGGEGRV